MSDRLPFEPHHVLCPLDFSELSDLALKYAAVGAKAYGARFFSFRRNEGLKNYELLINPFFRKGEPWIQLD